MTRVGERIEELRERLRQLEMVRGVMDSVTLTAIRREAEGELWRGAAWDGSTPARELG